MDINAELTAEIIDGCKTGGTLMSKFPLNLQFFAEPTDPPATPPAALPSASVNPSAAQIAEETLKLIDAASEKKARGIAKSMAEQNGLTEEELLASIAEKKAAKAKALPDEAQKRIDAAEAELKKYKLSSEVTKEGAALGLLDPDVAMTLLGEDATKANDKGEFAGLKPALEKLKETKPYLFKVAEATATGQKANVGGKVTGNPNAITKEQFAKMNLRQRADLQAKDPALYKALKGE